MDHSDSQLVFRDIPIFLWMIGLIFAAVGVLILYDGGRAPAMGLVFAAFGLGCLLFPGVLKVTADRATRTLKLEYRSLLRYKRKEFLFDDIAGIDVERSVSSGKNGPVYTYSVVLKRKDGDVIPFHTYSSSGRRKKDRQAGRLRDFIGVPGFDAAGAGVPGAGPLANPAEVHETNGVHWQIRQMKTTGVATATRWHSPDFKTPGVFLLIAQKAEGQASQGFLASLGSMIFVRMLPLYGFQADDTPGLDQATTLAPLDPALETHFMAFTNDPAAAEQRLRSGIAQPLASWAGRHPVRQFQKTSNSSQLAVLFGPNGVCLSIISLLQPDQLNELAALGADLVRLQMNGPGPYN